MTATESKARTKVARALRRYRVMAFATGTALVLACIALLLQKVFDVSHMGVPNAILWVSHGYLFLIYVMVTVHLAITLRWPLLRLLLVGVAGTIPTMSFVAEHFVTRDVRASGALGAAEAA